MTKRDYYETLGVNKNANEVDIKKAFRRLAMKYHPDRNAGDKSAEENFKEVKEAYDVLSDSRKRSAYDQFGHAGVNQSAAGGGFGGAGFNFEDIFGDIGDVFGDIFGAGRRGGAGRSYGMAGSDLRYELSISLEEAVQGITKQIKVPTLVTCSECNGSGARKGSSPSSCPECGGTGQIRLQQGFFSVQQTCPKCRGAGQIVMDPCTACHGQGRKQQTKTLSVKIPAGIDTGDRIRLSSEGEAGARGGPAGDLYVEIHVQRHSIFIRKGNDLYCEIPIGFITAALGGEIDAPTLEGRVKLKIPTETQTGKTFRLRGKGVKSVRGMVKGDILCRIIVETPIRLNQEQKTLFNELAKSLAKDNVDHTPRAGTWFAEVKKFFKGLGG